MCACQRAVSDSVFELLRARRPRFARRVVCLLGRAWRSDAPHVVCAACVGVAARGRVCHLLFVLSSVAALMLRSSPRDACTPRRVSCGVIAASVCRKS
jgi:hypothetical protein